jgi:tetratricopeptide (TPR) repeat protein/DNA-binding winged helix-turn-helix (wHTH) protein
MVRVGNDRRWVQFGPYRADLRARELSKHGTRTKVQARPFEILAMLLERPGDVVTREEIRTQLWPDGTFVDFDSNISSAVRKLRDTLCDSASDPRYIETVGRVGYRFIAEAEFTGEDAVVRPDKGSIPFESFGSTPSSGASSLGGSVAVAPEPAIETDVPEVANPNSTPDSHRISSQRFLLVSILCVGIAVPIVAVSRRWLKTVTAAGSTSPSAARAVREAAAEYSAGRELWSRRGEANLKAAIERFQSAIAKRPDYGWAYSGLADAYVLLPFYSGFSQAEAYSKAKAAALKAVELAPQSAEAHTSLAYVKLYADWDFRGAEEEFRIALQQNPDYPTALQWHAEYLSLIGRFDDAVSEIKRAIALMPDSPIMHHNAGQIYQAARRYDDAIAEYDTALRLDPTFRTSRVFTSLAYTRKGMRDKGAEIGIETVVETGDPTQIAVARRLTDSYRLKGFEGYLREVIAIQLEDNPDRYPYRIALNYAQLGEKDQVFYYLDRAYQLHHCDLLLMNVDPELDFLRSDPRFLALRRRVGLPVQELWSFSAFGTGAGQRAISFAIWSATRGGIPSCD